MPSHSILRYLGNLLLQLAISYGNEFPWLSIGI
jgi:hypothetical protein